MMRPGTIVNKRYKVLARVGRGGMGTVLRCQRLSDGEIVALKYCHLKDPTALRRFTREVRSMKELAHPHVVPVLATGIKHDPPYFVMPFADGSCAEKLADYATDENLALDAFLELCKGVQAIHGAGLVHRDLKPDNALILEGVIAISDLGLAKPMHRVTTVLTETRMIVGTEMYLAPEQRLPGGSRDADHRTDVYQLGKTLYQFLTGEEPVLMDMSRLPSGLAHVIRKATREHPAERYSNVGQLIDAVRTARAARDPSANPITSFEAVIGRINERLERGEYRAKELRELLSILSLPAVRASADQLLELFDQIPSELLAVIAESHGEDLLPVLEAYVEALEREVGDRAFSYAEYVAQKMDAVFTAAGATAEIKALCVEAVLLGAVRLNRFAAMNSFNEMLAGLKDDADAMAVCEALNRRRREYKAICSQMASLKLHPVIRELRDELAGEEG